MYLDTDMTVLAGGSREESGTRRFVLARFFDGAVAEPTRSAEPTDDDAALVQRSAITTQTYPQPASGYVITTAPYEITRTGAFAGGWVNPDAGLTFTRRGVVYSIAPNPVLKSGETELDPSPPPAPPASQATVCLPYVPLGRPCVIPISIPRNSTSNCLPMKQQPVDTQPPAAWPLSP